MIDRLTEAQRSLNMRRIRGIDTLPELILRRALHALGLRYAVNKRDLPGSPDIALSRFKTVVFVHGCFWHGHACYRAKIPSTRTEFWTNKIQANQARDARVEHALRELHWRIIVVWECSLQGRTKLGAQNVANACFEFVNRNYPDRLEIAGQQSP